tara:strand:- start:329 stop:667 length:339 start_codon:yes stop_codon:yes gene_type:complete
MQTLKSKNKGGRNIMFFSKSKVATATKGRKRLSKTQKVVNLFEKGEPVSWKVLRNRFDLQSPRAMVDKLRSKGHMIYINKSSSGTSYRLGTPTKAIIAAGITKLYGTEYAYN